MRALSSLKNRVFLASSFVAVVSIALGTRFVTARVSMEAEAELGRDLAGAAELLAEHYRSRRETLGLLAWLVADLPKLKAAVATGDPPTVAPVAEDYRERTGSDFLVVTDGRGAVLSSFGTEDPTVVREVVARALTRGETSSFVETSTGWLEIVSLPILVGPEPAEVLGTLSLGFELGEDLARELKAIAQSEIVLLAGGRVVASTISMTRAEEERLATSSGASVFALGDDELVSVERSLGEEEDGEAPRALILRSRTERLSFLRTFREGLVLSALFSILLAVVLSYAVARTVTRPLAAITETIQDITSTGDLARKIEIRGRWVDENAAVLALSFNRLTEAIARFQRESMLKERLSALGRMSTVLAHEIRNPLMIIKASLGSLRNPQLEEADVREAAEDIDHEVGRLNRMVGDVLDFAKPVAPDRSPTDVNEVCRLAAESLSFDEPPGIRLRLQDGLPELVTDGERLRTALVNVLGNARDAVRERAERDGLSLDETEIELFTSALLPAGSGEGERGVVIAVRDAGIGIAPQDLPRIFEPYFTGKRTGTGLGLAIAKNIIDSLGGSVSAASAPGEGTELRIELDATGPSSPPAREDEALVDSR